MPTKINAKQAAQRCHDARTETYCVTFVLAATLFNTLGSKTACAFLAPVIQVQETDCLP
jgi:hypothetical protein